MQITSKSILLFVSILTLGAAACFSTGFTVMSLLSPVERQVSDPAATLQAILTQNAQNAPTATPLPPTATPVPVTNTPAPTPTRVSYCDWVSFVTDVSVPDGTVFSPGENFTKIWRLKNRGTCTWTPDYALVFTGGAGMSGPTVVRLPGYVAPGQTVDLPVYLTAPSAPGHYTGYWTLRNPSGTLFGYGDRADQAFYVDIKVRDPGLPHGTVSGRLCYPGEFNPPLILYFERADTGEVIQFSIPENRDDFSVLLPNGSYYAYAWAPGYSLEGAYTWPNGLMKTFKVRGGQTTGGIRLCDWTIDPHTRGQ